MASHLDDVITVLNNLIQTCKDRQYGYETAAKAVSDSQLQLLCRAYERQSNQFAAELQDEVRRLDGDPESGGSVTGGIKRGWTNGKSAITDGNESSVIAECERGEEAARQSYENALKELLPADVQALIQRQFAGVREGHDRMRALEVVVDAI